MKQRKFPWFWLLFALLIIAYPIFWWISAATTEVNPDAAIQLDPYQVSLVFAIILSPIYAGALVLLTVIREILLFVFKKISKKRFITVVSILGTLVIAALIYLILAV